MMMLNQKLSLQKILFWYGLSRRRQFSQSLHLFWIIHLLVTLCVFSLLFVKKAEAEVLVGVIHGDAKRSIKGITLDLIGARLAIDELNRQGGLLGKKVTLIELNNNGTPVDSKLAAEQAVKAGVISVIGPGVSSHALIAGTVLQKAGIPMISPFATNPEVTRIGDFIFRICFTDHLQGQALAHFAFNDLKAKNAVILTCAGEKYSLGLSAIFKSSFTEQGGVIAWEGEYLNSSTDFKQLLEKAFQYNPSVIFLPGYDRASGFIIRQCRNMGKNIPFIGGDAWSSNIYKYGGNSVEGSYYSRQWDPKTDKVNSREFVNLYKDRFQNDEILLFGMFRDAVFLLADAVNRANSLEPAAIRRTLATTKNFPGITGTLSMDPNGDPAKPIPIFAFKDGAGVLVKTVTP